MKKTLLTCFLIAVVALMATSCSTYKSASKYTPEEDAVLIFVDSHEYDIDVTVDRDRYHVKTVKEKDLNHKRNLKRAAENMIYVSPGRHDVLVRSRGKVLYEQRISVRVDETKLIKL
ncbi:MAG: hypothetical protein J5478_05020 [Bacteroidales bacterium]|nr:hypothetical protein [Bacteroidales bacterium]